MNIPYGDDKGYLHFTQMILPSYEGILAALF